ncbi:hypothetical protein BC831DRAFT_453508 [Entophlyctis helioformis]|nr:hypothetical protein BC831DRAFT_453508 [Entophlyctis helioformis]
MTPMITFQTPIEMAAIIVYIPCFAGSVALVVYCLNQQHKKHTRYGAWLLAATALLLISQIFGALRCFANSGQLPRIITSYSAPVALCTATYMLTEMEFYLLTSAAVDVQSKRRRLMLWIMGGSVLCWTMRILADYRIWSPGPPLVHIDSALVALFLVVTNVGDVVVQARMMFTIQHMLKNDIDSCRRYSTIARTFLVLLVLYNFLSGGLFIGSLVVWSDSVLVSEALLLLTVSIPTAHFTLSIVLMQTGRQYLLEARKPRSAPAKQRKSAGSKLTLAPPRGVVASAVVGYSPGPTPSLMSSPLMPHPTLQ